MFATDPSSKKKQERDLFTDLRRLCVTNLVSFLDKAIFEKNVFTLDSFLEKFFTPIFSKKFSFSHLFFDIFFHTPFGCTLGK